MLTHCTVKVKHSGYPGKMAIETVNYYNYLALHLHSKADDAF